MSGNYNRDNRKGHEIRGIDCISFDFDLTRCARLSLKALIYCSSAEFEKAPSLCSVEENSLGSGLGLYSSDLMRLRPNY